MSVVTAFLTIGFVAALPFVLFLVLFAVVVAKLTKSLIA